VTREIKKRADNSETILVQFATGAAMRKCSGIELFSRVRLRRRRKSRAFRLQTDRHAYLQSSPGTITRFNIKTISIEGPGLRWATYRGHGQRGLDHQ